MDHWTEVNLVHDRAPDERLFLQFALPLVDTLRPRFRSWHFLWEPDLWLRFRWHSAEDKTQGEESLRAALERGESDGLFRAWRFNAYTGDAHMYGEEMWPLIERDFENGSELVAALVRHESESRLTKERDYHWARHVHIFTDQLYASWSDEARLSIRQGRYRTWLLRRASKGYEKELDEMLTELDRLLARVEVLDAAETEFLTRWRAEGRPDLVAFLGLDRDFDGDPGKH